MVRYEKRLRLFGAAIKKFGEYGGQLVKLGFWGTLIDRTIRKAVEEVGPEKADRLDQEGQAMEFEEALEYAFNTNLD